MSRISKHKTYTRLGTTRAMTNQRILIVDDDDEVCLSLRDSVAAWLDNIEVLTVPSAERALEVMAREPVHLIITDQRLPGVDGVDLMHQVKALYPRLPGILITAHPDMALVQDALRRTNVCTFLAKPVRLESVITAVAGLLHLHDTHTGLSRAVSKGLRELRSDLRSLHEGDTPGRAAP